MGTWAGSQLVAHAVLPIGGSTYPGGMLTVVA
jgi:hypothetical protein